MQFKTLRVKGVTISEVSFSIQRRQKKRQRVKQLLKDKYIKRHKCDALRDLLPFVQF